MPKASSGWFLTGTVLVMVLAVVVLVSTRLEGFATCDLLSGFVSTVTPSSATRPAQAQPSGQTPSVRWAASPPLKQVGGYSSSGDNRYVCQAQLPGGTSVLPGETTDSAASCDVAWNGAKVAAQDFTYLDGSSPMYYSKFPARKVVGGRGDTGTQWVCRAAQNGEAHIGRTWSGADACHIPVDGKEMAVADLEYLSLATPGGTAKPVLAVSNVDAQGDAFKMVSSVGGDDVCSKLCSAAPACNSAFYDDGTDSCTLRSAVNPQNLTTRSGTLHLKVNSAPDPTWKSNTSITGTALTSVPTASASDCSLLCSAIAPCRAANWDSSGLCSLKSSVSGNSPDSSTQGWLK
ncbi:hypothetical protein CVIRNUC_004579 [Coccomyxa viridis]|uniref:Apple domain-containing protein n=1 Tax=Coccomyxa viridis TaxID=1274662 RepID=A0AAV1I2W6_9CHLO|nr:hypothetical protein CVIRNUC_004579 [Coccomyxa viridis]